MEIREIKRTFSRIGLALALFMGIAQGSSFALGLAVSRVAPHLAETGWFLWVLSYGPLYLIAFPLFFVTMNHLPTMGEGLVERQKLSVEQMVKMVIISIGIIYPLNLLTLLFSFIVEMIRGKGLTNPLQEIALASNPWIMLLFAVIIAPIMEEIIFRRMLYNKLIGLGGKVYVLFSAFVFALFHANLYQMFYAFALGVLFAGITYYTGTIRYSIILHMVINFIGSGAGTLLLTYGSEGIVGIWGLLILSMVIVGINMGVKWMKQHRSEVNFGPTPYPVSASTALINPGMLLYMGIISALIVLSFLV